MLKTSTHHLFYVKETYSFFYLVAMVVALEVSLLEALHPKPQSYQIEQMRPYPLEKKSVKIVSTWDRDKTQKFKTQTQRKENKKMSHQKEIGLTFTYKSALQCLFVSGVWFDKEFERKRRAARSQRRLLEC